MPPSFANSQLRLEGEWELMKTEPILFVQYQRDLSDGRVVVCGPSCGGSCFHWTSGKASELKLVNPHDPAETITATLGYENPQLLSSTEQLGYDPFSTEYPALREIQNYTSAILSIPKPRENLLGLVVLPVQANVRFIHCRMRLVLDGLEQLSSLLLEDIAQVHEQETLVLRWENSINDGFLLLSAKDLSSGFSLDSEATLILPRDGSEALSGNLYCLRPYRQPGTRRTEYREVLVGSCSRFIETMAHTEMAG